MLIRVLIDFKPPGGSGEQHVLGVRRRGADWQVSARDSGQTVPVLPPVPQAGAHPAPQAARGAAASHCRRRVQLRTRQNTGGCTQTH